MGTLAAAFVASFLSEYYGLEKTSQFTLTLGSTEPATIVIVVMNSKNPLIERDFVTSYIL